MTTLMIWAWATLREMGFAGLAIAALSGVVVAMARHIVVLHRDRVSACAICKRAIDLELHVIRLEQEHARIEAEVRTRLDGLIVMLMEKSDGH